MKTTVELPDPLFRKAKSLASERGQTLKEFMTEALEDKLAKLGTRRPREPQWMKGFGKLRPLHRQTARIQKRIDETFETISFSSDYRPDGLLFRRSLGARSHRSLRYPGPWWSDRLAHSNPAQLQQRPT